MARIPNIKRITQEDFSKEDQGLIDKLAFPINSFMEQVRSAFDHNIDFTNLNREVITLTVSVDAGGVPLVQTLWKSNLKTKIVGVNVIRASSIQDPGLVPINTPFINFVQNASLVQINQISGLQPDNKYQLVIESIGS